MKLRNKKTGIRGCIEYVMRTIDPISGEPLLTVRYKDDTGINCYIDYKTVAEFNEEWEDYKEPTEPLITGGKFIDLFKHWAEINNTVYNNADKCKPKFMYDKGKDILWYVDSCGDPSYCIGFNEYSALRKLKNEQLYSYYDLVGK